MPQGSLFLRMKSLVSSCQSCLPMKIDLLSFRHYPVLSRDFSSWNASFVHFDLESLTRSLLSHACKVTSDYLTLHQKSMMIQKQIWIQIYRLKSVQLNHCLNFLNCISSSCPYENENLHGVLKQVIVHVYFFLENFLK